jgi:hypothetical protein
MELWEGAILAVGGIFLVGYMSQKNQAAVLAGQSALAAATTVTPAGTSNSSNLTNITNSAGGQPTVIGEPLEPPQAPIFPGGVVGPNTTGGGSGSVLPIPTPRGTIAQPARGFLGGGSTMVPSPVNSTPWSPTGPGRVPVRPVDIHL